ncbi:MAG: hypothetical protein CL678_17000 [Bdellovibrionaceae bacterium]|nr:hypothetical protein [Pseudobdellovibrionaceae bacterium]|tara:strand:- start:218 stop:1186 length:969 start_codon:yes stop_codon:yes gene_type:complete
MEIQGGIALMERAKEIVLSLIVLSAVGFLVWKGWHYFEDRHRQQIVKKSDVLIKPSEVTPDSGEVLESSSQVLQNQAHEETSEAHQAHLEKQKIKQIELKNHLMKKKVSQWLTQKTCDLRERLGSFEISPESEETLIKKIHLTFDQSKKKLKRWLKNHNHLMNDAQYSQLEEQLNRVSLEFPASQVAKDLMWRGALFLEVEDSESFVVRGGNSWMWTYKNDLKRAEYEMTRVIAQAWSPCLLLKSSGVWNQALECASIDFSCKGAGRDEAGHWIASAVAHWVSPMDCQIPLFKKKDQAQCLLESPLYLSQVRDASALYGSRL